MMSLFSDIIEAITFGELTLSAISDWQEVLVLCFWLLLWYMLYKVVKGVVTI